MLVAASLRPDGVVPMGLVFALRHLAIGSDPLLPRPSRSDSTSLKDPALAQILAGVELGVWSLGPRSINVLGDVIDRLRPKLVVEFGSGVSTVAMAYFLRMQSAGSETQLIALEQDVGYANSTRDRLRANNLADRVVVVHAPLVVDNVEGKRSIRYDLTPEFMSAIADRSPDLIIIDGPVAETGGRFGTLPLLRPFVRRADFVMDDAIRDSELQTAKDWSSLSYVTLDGIRPLEKGLLFGTVETSPDGRLSQQEIRQNGKWNGR